jgi:hypothetical protein
MPLIMKCFHSTVTVQVPSFLLLVHLRKSVMHEYKRSDFPVAVRGSMQKA